MTKSHEDEISSIQLHMMDGSRLLRYHADNAEDSDEGTEEKTRKGFRKEED
jgi:hypothetical protein